jgi:hypothetical protein
MRDDVAQVLRVSETDITIAPQSVTTLAVQVNDSPKLAPGGHYATLVMTPVPLSSSKNTATPGVQSSLRSSISVAVYISKRTGAVSVLNLDQQHLQRFLFGMPKSSTLTMSNQGNIHGIPRVIVKVTSTDDDRLMAQGVAADLSTALLPGKTTTSTIAITKLAESWRPLKIQVQTAYRFDGSEAVKSSSATLWYIPSRFVALVVGVVAVWAACSMWIWQLTHGKHAVKLRRQHVTFGRLLFRYLIPRRFRKSAVSADIHEDLPTAQVVVDLDSKPIARTKKAKKPTQAKKHTKSKTSQAKKSSKTSEADTPDSSVEDEDLL